MTRRQGRPGEWHICTKCRGEGHHSQHLGAYSATEFAEEFDPEEQEAYFAGRYDRQCERCLGSGKLWLDTGPCIAGDQGDGVCPCSACADLRATWRREEARMQWIESGCPDDFYYEG